MNVNERIISLEQIIGYPVSQDIYEGKEDKYIVFNYEDERVELFGDNKELMETAYLHIAFYTPKDYDYHSDKKLIKKELKKMGFNVESSQSWLEQAAIQGTKYMRHTAFYVNITEAAEE